MRVLVVDDSAFMRKVISQMIDETTGLEVVGTARNGVEGVKLAEELEPDLITLDIEMPELDGLGALRQIRVKCRKTKPAVLMCSSLTTDGSAEAFKALRLGAADVIAKDPATVGKKDAGFKHNLIAKLRAIAGERQRTASAPHAPKPTKAAKAVTTPPPADIDLSNVEAVVIGSSTGGPPVLEDILGPMPSGLRVPIIVAQHMPPLFTKTLADRLDQHCLCNARLVTDKTLVDAPGIYVAEGGRHLHLSRHPHALARAEMKTEPTEAVYRPSVDVLFSTAARVFAGRVLAIQLTGMGDDGAQGAAAVRAAGGRVIAQSADSCVVYGMPKAVVESGNADAQMSPAQIGLTLAQLCGSAGSETAPQTAPPLRKIA